MSIRLVLWVVALVALIGCGQRDLMLLSGDTTVRLEWHGDWPSSPTGSPDSLDRASLTTFILGLERAGFFGGLSPREPPHFRVVSGPARLVIHSWKASARADMANYPQLVEGLKYAPFDVAGFHFDAPDVTVIHVFPDTDKDLPLWMFAGVMSHEIIEATAHEEIGDVCGGFGWATFSIDGRDWLAPRYEDRSGQCWPTPPPL